MLEGRAERVLHTRAPEIAVEKVVSVGATKANIVNGVGEGEVKVVSERASKKGKYGLGAAAKRERSLCM